MPSLKPNTKSLRDEKLDFGKLVDSAGLKVDGLMSSPMVSNRNPIVSARSN